MGSFIPLQRQQVRDNSTLITAVTNRVDNLQESVNNLRLDTVTKLYELKQKENCTTYPNPFSMGDNIIFKKYLALGNSTLTLSGVKSEYRDHPTKSLEKAKTSFDVGGTVYTLNSRIYDSNKDMMIIPLDHAEDSMTIKISSVNYKNREQTLNDALTNINFYYVSTKEGNTTPSDTSIGNLESIINKDSISYNTSGYYSFSVSLPLESVSNLKGIGIKLNHTFYGVDESKGPLLKTFITLTLDESNNYQSSVSKQTLGWERLDEFTITDSILVTGVITSVLDSVIDENSIGTEFLFKKSSEYVQSIFPQVNTCRVKKYSPFSPDSVFYIKWEENIDDNNEFKFASYLDNITVKDNNEVINYNYTNSIESFLINRDLNIHVLNDFISAGVIITAKLTFKETIKKLFGVSESNYTTYANTHILPLKIQVVSDLGVKGEVSLDTALISEDNVISVTFDSTAVLSLLSESELSSGNCYFNFNSFLNLNVTITGVYIPHETSVKLTDDYFYLGVVSNIPEGSNIFFKTTEDTIIQGLESLPQKLKTANTLQEVQSTDSDDKLVSAKAVKELTSNVQMKFGVDSKGNYGYIKVGADTVTPFNSKNWKEITNKAVEGTNTFNIKEMFPDEHEAMSKGKFIVSVDDNTDYMNGGGIPWGTYSDQWYGEPSFNTSRSFSVDFNQSTEVLTVKFFILARGSYRKKGRGYDAYDTITAVVKNPYRVYCLY